MPSPHLPDPDFQIFYSATYYSLRSSTADIGDENINDKIFLYIFLASVELYMNNKNVDQDIL